jgi:hypothetical protein
MATIEPLKQGDVVHWLFEGKTFGLAACHVVKVGRKWLTVTFGADNITRKVALDGQSAKMGDRFSLRKVEPDGA